jgi:hypothetical protein
MTPFHLLLLLLGAVPSAVAYAAMIGLGVARQGDPAAVALASTALVFGPALAAGIGEVGDRVGRFAAVQLVWSVCLFAALPVYFPGERRDAVATGIALFTLRDGAGSVANTVADSLPEEPTLAAAQLPTALGMPPTIAPPASPLGLHEIALPYEGEGRRLSVPVVFEHEGRTLETFMMLDTGATYTTLPLSVLQELGAAPAMDAPELTLNTANGERRAQVVLLDEVWLGDKVISGVAITTCDDCASEDSAGLLGLNVAGGYNVTIDADRREVIFAARQSFNRRLDVRPFSDLQARFTRYPDGRVELTLDVANLANRAIAGGAAKITCGEQEWIVPLDPVEAGAVGQVRRRLPRHDECAGYQFTLDAAWW